MNTKKIGLLCNVWCIVQTHTKLSIWVPVTQIVWIHEEEMQLMKVWRENVFIDLQCVCEY